MLENSGITAVAVLTLALGIGANAVVFSVAKTLLFRPLGYANVDRLMWIKRVNARTGAIDYGESQAAELHRRDRLQVRASADPAQPWANWRPLNGIVTVQEGAFVLEDPLGSGPAQFYRAMEIP